MTDERATPAGPHADLLSGSARLRARRRAELRLKLYGIAALLVAAGALAVLLGTVLRQAGGAFTATHLTLPVALPAAEIDPDAIREADFAGLVAGALAARFPAAQGRQARRDRRDLVSRGASFRLRDRVMRDPALIGRTVEQRFLASDTVDLFLHGDYGRLRERPASGTLSVTRQENGRLRLSSSEDDFAGALRMVKAGLSGDAERLRARARRQQNGVEVYTERAASAATDDARAENRGKAEAARETRDALLSNAEALEARAGGAGGAEPLDDEDISLLVAVAGGWLRLTEVDRASATAEVLQPLSGGVSDTGGWSFYTVATPEALRQVSDAQIAWVEDLRQAGQLDRAFNWRFFTAADSRAPELAGIRGAVVGSFWTMLVTFCLAFPVGVLGAIYLEEFAARNRFTDFIEVNINNLAAVPSIVYGLLGLAVFIGFFGVPRSSPLAGGIVLALMTLPTIIIAARAAVRAVPPSIRNAALGVGASPLQASFHHVLPLAMPGILTGTIIGMAQALGETAPLLMIGMVAFIVDVPHGVTDSATVLPVQVFRWSGFPERAFEARTGAAILVLLGFLVAMNGVAIFLRKRFERRW